MNPMRVSIKDIQVLATDVAMDQDYETLVFARLIASPEEARGIAYAVKNEKVGYISTQPYFGPIATPPDTEVRRQSVRIHGIDFVVFTLYLPRYPQLQLFYLISQGDPESSFQRFAHAHTPYPVPPLRPGLIQKYADRLDIFAATGRIAAWRMAENAIRNILEEASR